MKKSYPYILALFLVLFFSFLLNVSVDSVSAQVNNKKPNNSTPASNNRSIGGRFISGEVTKIDGNRVTISYRMPGGQSLESKRPGEGASLLSKSLDKKGNTNHLAKPISRNTNNNISKIRSNKTGTMASSTSKTKMESMTFTLTDENYRNSRELKVGDKIKVYGKYTENKKQMSFSADKVNLITSSRNTALNRNSERSATTTLPLLPKNKGSPKSNY